MSERARIYISERLYARTYAPPRLFTKFEIGARNLKSSSPFSFPVAQIAPSHMSRSLLQRSKHITNGTELGEIVSASDEAQGAIFASEMTMFVRANELAPCRSPT